MDKPKRLADIKVKGLYPDAEMVEMEDILDKEIVITDMSEVPSEFGNFSVFLFHYPEKEEMFSTACGGYKVVQRLLEAKVQGWFPLPANISRPGRSYEVK